MSGPKRIQMSRQHPWRADNPDAVIVARPSKWGNPFRCQDDPQRAVDAFRGLLTAPAPWAVELHGGLSMAFVPDSGWDARLLRGLPGLRGKDLACWCPLDQPCHADVLLELANAPQATAHPDVPDFGEDYDR